MDITTKVGNISVLRDDARLRRIPVEDVTEEMTITPDHNGVAHFAEAGVVFTLHPTPDQRGTIIEWRPIHYAGVFRTHVWPGQHVWEYYLAD